MNDLNLWGKLVVVHSNSTKIDFSNIIPVGCGLNVIYNVWVLIIFGGITWARKEFGRGRSYRVFEFKGKGKKNEKGKS